MDPQQRLFLEVAIEAIDDAGFPQERLRGSRRACSSPAITTTTRSFSITTSKPSMLRTLTGTLHSVLANRLSYLLDLRGPSISIDTACSSSLVAVHLACQSLRSGETQRRDCRWRVPDGRARTHGRDVEGRLHVPRWPLQDVRCRADGFGRGEGCGVVVLKRLSDAIADATGYWRSSEVRLSIRTATRQSSQRQTVRRRKH